MMDGGRSVWTTVAVESITASILFGSLVIFTLLDLTNYGVAWIERISYGLVCLAALLAAALAIPELEVPRRGWLLISGWFVAVLVYLLPTAGQRFIYPSYIVGDMLSLLLPILILVAGWSSRSLFSSRSVALLVTGLLVVSLTAPIFGALGTRFEPPPTLLTAAAWWGTFAAKRPSHRVVLSGVVLLVGFLALDSGQRTALLVWVVCGAFVTWRSMPRTRWKWLIVLMGVLAIAATTALAGRDVLVDLASRYRIASIAASGQDDSLIARANEAADVASTLRRDGAPGNWIVGFGHGATYRPQSSFLSRNVTPEGRVHNVHIGPLLILFRYGLAGLAAYVLGLLFVARMLIRLSKARNADDASGFFVLATAAYLIEGLMFNVLVDPLFSYALAGMFAKCLDFRSPVTASGNGDSLAGHDTRMPA